MKVREGTVEIEVRYKFLVVIFSLISISYNSEANLDGENNLVSSMSDKQLGDSIEIPKNLINILYLSNSFIFVWISIYLF